MTINYYITCKLLTIIYDDYYDLCWITAEKNVETSDQYISMNKLRVT